ncbi:MULTISPECIES: hypothetical protein [Streptomyces]|uniref:Uncharacterized protein n=1 Tax=Streptomyces sp. 900129855 TaxID=3155129 RepID=A0ABV2ZTF5_9ACTN
MTAPLEAPTPITPDRITFLELEITRECQLTCPSHCYAQAGPGAGHGSMTGNDWRRVISDAAGIGVTKVQFIGGCRRELRVPRRSRLFGGGRNRQPVSLFAECSVSL